MCTHTLSLSLTVQFICYFIADTHAQEPTHYTKQMNERMNEHENANANKNHYKNEQMQARKINIVNNDNRPTEAEAEAEPVPVE